MESTRRLLEESLSPSLTTDSQENCPASNKYFGFTSRQFRFIVAYGLFNVFRGAYIVIVGPFYPPEAFQRGISTPTVGLILGSYNLAAFCSILFYGKFCIPHFGPHRVIIFSTVVTTICATLFGCMGFLKERTTFLISSFALRLIGGVGDAGFYPSAYAIFAVEFPDLVSTSISLFEIFFGIGAIFGPIACGPVIDHIGFEWTYISLGSCLLLASSLILLITPIPRPRRDTDENLGTSRQEEGASQISSVEDTDSQGYAELLRIPAIQFAIFCLFATAVSIGYITGTLRVHLEQFHLSSLQIGAVFSVTTGIYTVFSLAWGQLSDKLQMNKIIIITSGSLLVAVGFFILGPLSIILKEPYLWATLAGLCLHGVGIGSSIIVSFSYASESAVKRGFPDTTATNGLVSSILALPFALGNAFGPAASSALYQAVGFDLASLSVIGLSCIVILSAVLLLISEKRNLARNVTQA